MGAPRLTPAGCAAPSTPQWIIHVTAPSRVGGNNLNNVTRHLHLLSSEQRASADRMFLKSLVPFVFMLQETLRTPLCIEPNGKRSQSQTRDHENERSQFFPILVALRADRSEDGFPSQVERSRPLDPNTQVEQSCELENPTSQRKHTKLDEHNVETNPCREFISGANGENKLK